MVITFAPLEAKDYEIDLWADLGRSCRAELANMGYQNISSTDPEELCTMYLNALFRRVQAKPRNFHRSTQLAVPLDHQSGFDLLKEKVERGTDLTPHLSGLLSKEDFNDPLLNAWKIHHFHLGVNPHKNNPSLVERTGPILLALVEPDDFYAIDIIAHGKHGYPEVFYEQNLIEILHNNWPNMMNRYRLKNAKAAFPQPSNAEVKLVRDAGITMIPQTADGSLYMPAAGFTSVGGTTKDTGAQIVFEVMKITNAVKLLQKTIVEKMVSLELAFDKNGGRRPYNVILTNFLNGMITAREESSKVGMRISSKPAPPGEKWIDIWSEHQALPL